MVYSKPELDRIGTVADVVLADAPHSGSDQDSGGTGYPYRPIPELEFE